MDSTDITALQRMKSAIEEIEKLTLELAEIGQGVQAVEKNSRMILSATYNLRCGISDIADLYAERGGENG